MAKEESKKEKKSKRKAAAKAAGPDARTVVVASVASFLEAGGFPRAFAALQSEAHLEEGDWKSAAVSLEDLVSEFLESSSSAPVTATVGNNEQDKANEAREKKKNKKGDTEASEPESKVIEPSAEEKPSENVGAETKEKKHKKKKKDGSSAEETKETVKGDDQKVDGKKKKSQKQEEDDDVEARLDKASLAIQNKLEATGELKEDGSDGAADKTKKKKKGKSEKTVGSVAAEGDGAKAQTDGNGTVKDDNGKKAKKKRKKYGSEEYIPEEGKDNYQGKSAMELEEGENGKPSSESAVVGKKQKLEVEESKTPATENGTTSQTFSNGFAEDDSKENSTITKPSKRQKTSAEPKSVTPFQRVKMEAVKFADDRLQDNSYWAKGGAEIGYGAKAQVVLGQVRGRGFRHEKTKKKRGTYRSGQIDLGTHSIKFENSDDE